jgi:hypothetical protein
MLRLSHSCAKTALSVTLKRITELHGRLRQKYYFKLKQL